MVGGLAGSQNVAEARRNPRPATPPATVSTPVQVPVATPTPSPAPTVVASAAPASPTVRFSDTFEGAPAGLTWTDGSAHGNWVDVFNGYGSAGIEADGDQVLTLAPKVATQPGETHSALAVTAAQFSDIDVTLQMRTVAQLRTGSAPNPWETAWALWSYTDNTHFYYLVLKPNGLEIGKEDPAYSGNQRFLVTQGNVQYPVGRWYTVRVKQVASTFTVWVDGGQVAQFTDTERPYTGGAIGLYTEDAYAHFNNVVVQ